MISLDLTKSLEVRKAGDQPIYLSQLDRSPAFLTSDNFVRSNEIVRTKWLIYSMIGHFVLTILSLDSNDIIRM